MTVELYTQLYFIMDKNVLKLCYFYLIHIKVRSKGIFHLYLPQESNKTEKGDRFSPQAGE